MERVMEVKMTEILKRGVNLVVYTIRGMENTHHKSRITRSTIQNLLYFFDLKSDIDLHYTIYHSGVSSPMVDRFLSVAESLGYIERKWSLGKGYTFTLSEAGREINPQQKDLRILSEIIKTYGSFSLKELTIVTIALYLKENFNVIDSKKIVKAVLSIKPTIGESEVKRLLQDTGIG